MTQADRMVCSASGELPAGELGRVRAAVEDGKVLLYPTDTIYGLGCDALNRSSVEQVYAIKRRPEEKPMIVLVHSVEAAERLTGRWGARARALADAFWPGPLTILVRADAEQLPWLAGATGKIGIRFPEHRFCRELLEATGRPLLSTSANISGEPYDGSPERLRELFGPLVDLHIDAGVLPVSPPSTIVDASGDRPVLVREGALPMSRLEGHFA
jgi:L-threonylcarbamoyladenylate synthase